MRYVLSCCSLGLWLSLAGACLGDVQQLVVGDATAAIQQTLDQAVEGAEIVFQTGEYRLSGAVRIHKSVRLDFNGSVFRFDSGFTEKGFFVAPGAVCEFVEFRNGVFLGDGTLNANKGPVISSYSGCRIGRFNIEACTFRNLTYGCGFNCAHAGFIRNANLSRCLFENIVGNDAERGKGAAFSLNGAEICHGRSSGNVFIDCGRHSLYCSSGGRFLSDGDSFHRNNTGGETNYPLAAVSLARGSHMKITNGHFESCRDGISVTSGDANRQYSDVTIESCTFVGNSRYDISLNTDNPEANGVYQHILIQGTRHTLTADRSIAIAAWAYQDARLVDIHVFDQRPGDAPALWIAGRGESWGLQANQIQIGRNPQNITGRPKGNSVLYVRPEAASSILTLDVRHNGTSLR